MWFSYCHTSAGADSGGYQCPAACRHVHGHPAGSASVIRYSKPSACPNYPSGRRGDADPSASNTNSYTSSHSDSNPNSDAHGDPQADGYACTHTLANGNANTDSDAGAYGTGPNTGLEYR